MSAEWFFSAGGRPARGPVSAAELKELAAAGRLRPTDLVWREGAAAWVPAGRVRGLFPTPAAPAPVRPPPIPTGPSAPFPAPPLPPPTPVRAARPVAVATVVRDRPEHGEARPALWNPNAAANWSLVLTPAFGAYLHAANWRALGRPDRAATNMVFVWVTAGFLGANLLTFLAPAGSGFVGLVRLAGWGPLFVWYFTQGRPHARYVQETFGDDYPRKAWGLPLGVAAVGIGAYFVVCVALAVATDTPGPADPGTRLEFRGAELFYTTAVTRAEATRLGTYLVREQFFDGDPKTVQLSRTGRTYEFRFVTKKGIEQDAELIASLKAFAASLSRDVFESAPVDIHLCDEYLQTVRVVVAPR